MNKVYVDKALNVARYLHDIGTHKLPDRYAVLRHALFLSELLLESVCPGEPSLFLGREETVAALDPLTRVSLQEFAWSQALRDGQVLTADTVNSLTHGERAALFRGAVRSQTLLDAQLLVDQLGISDTLDALVRDALAVQAANGCLADFAAPLRRRFEEMQQQGNPRRLASLLDTAAQYKIPVLEALEVEDLLREWEGQERSYLALLRYVGSMRLRALLGMLHDLLDQSTELSLARRLALIDVLVRIGDPSSLPVLDRFVARLAREDTAGPRRVLCQYLDATLAALRAAEAPSPPDGLVIAQFMFMGRIGRPGKGDSGGLGVFLTSLGDALADVPGIAHVYTLVLLNAVQARDDPPLLTEHTARHTIIHIPVCCRDEITQYEMMTREYAVRTAVQRILATFRIRPDVFHIRYSDNGSRAAAQVARRMGKKVVFTITTDPHRLLPAAFAKRQDEELEDRDLSFRLYKVYIADQLLELADGLVAMPDSAGTAGLKAYFPQLILHPQARSKPLQMISEGIQVGRDRPEQVEEALLNEMCHYETCKQGVRLDLEFRDRPIMLNVGRLYPLKQQPLLVEAWVESGLWRDYNLVLIGGDLEDPTPIERKIQARIEAAFARYPQARGRFCLLPAMPNEQIRQLEYSMIELLPAPLPHVYVCSSQKEEFGIAVLEAMEAGFLVFGPEIGGLSSYIEPGTNGFLMDTSTASSIGTALTDVLRGGFTGDQLRAIAEAGSRTVRERFNIQETAKEFARFYREVAETGSGRDS